MNEQRQVTVQLKGVKRSTPAGGGDDGGCGHIVNMRFKDGAWRLAGEKVLSRVIESAQAAEVLNCSNLLYHETYFDGVIGSDNTTGDVIFFNFEDENKATLVDIDYAGGERVTDIRKFGKMLIIASNKDRYIFKWDDETNFYYEVPTLPRGQFAVWDEDRVPATFEGYLWYVPLSDATEYPYAISVLKKKLYDDGVTGYFEGHVFFRYAWKLYDGTLINHSAIHYAHIGIFSEKLSIGFYGATIKARSYLTNNPLIELTFSPDELSAIESLKGIVKNITVYMTPPISSYDFGDDVTTWSAVTHWGLNLYEAPLKETAEFNNLFKDSMAFYKIATYDIEDILLWDEVGSTGYRRKTDSIIIENIHAIETREAMDVDNFTHHRLSGSFLYDYNSRLHIADTVTRFADPINNGRKMLIKGTDDFNTAKRTLVFGANMSQILDFSYGADIYLEVDLETEEGMRMVRVQVPDDKLEEYGICIFKDTVNDKYYIYLLEIIIYPDIRARYIRVCAKSGSSYMALFGVELKEHQYLNCAYYQGSFQLTGNGNIGINYFELVDLVGNHVFRTINNTLRDANRVQASELGNVFVYPAKNSYRIGQKSNTVVSLATMSSPMGEGQFGQFPLHVFTDAGIYNLNQGSGEVLYGSIHRFNLDVLDAKDMLMELGGAVVYVSRGAVYMLAGSNRTRISQPLESKQDVEESDDYFGFPSGSACRDAIAPITWDSFLSGMKMAYNHNENELVLSNATAGISYVYQFATGAWFATNEAFKIFVMQANGGWIGITASGSMYDLTEEDETTNYSSHVCFVTRPMLLGNRGLKKISRTIGRMIFDVVSGSSVMMGVYGSLNARDWTLLRSVTFDNGVNGLSLNDVMIKDTHSSAKYFIISFRATVGNDFEFTGLDMSVEDRFNRKLR